MPMSDCQTWKPESSAVGREVEEGEPALAPVGHARDERRRRPRAGRRPRRPSGSSGVPPMKATASTIVASTMAEPRSPCSEHERRRPAPARASRAERRPQVVACGRRAGRAGRRRRAAARASGAPRLEAERTEVEPGPRPVDRDPEPGHERQRSSTANTTSRPGRTSDRHDVVRHAVGDEERRRAERGPQRLPAEVRPPELPWRSGVDRRGRQHHHEPEHHEDGDRRPAARRSWSAAAVGFRRRRTLADRRRRVAAHRLSARPAPAPAAGRRRWVVVARHPLNPPWQLVDEPGEVVAPLAVARSTSRSWRRPATAARCRRRGPGVAPPRPRPPSTRPP